MLLSLEQWEKKVMGTLVRDGQCVAAFREYMEKCHGVPHTGSVEGAIDLWTSFDKYPMMVKYFDRIDRDNIQSGDCPIFSATKTNKYGHVAICTDVHEDGMSCIEQDGFKLNGMKTGFWTWTRFVGALRAK